MSAFKFFSLLEETRVIAGNLRVGGSVCKWQLTHHIKGMHRSDTCSWKLTSCSALGTDWKLPCWASTHLAENFVRPPRMWFGRPFVTLIIVNKLSEVVTWTVLVTIVRLFCNEFNYYKRVFLLGQCNMHHSSCTELVILWYFAVEIMLLFFSCSVVSDSLWLHGLQHSRLPCPSPSPRVCSDTCLLSQWCHPTVILCYPLLLLPLIFPSIRVFFDESALRIRWPKYWSCSFSISPSNEYSDNLGLTGLISLLSRDS